MAIKSHTIHFRSSSIHYSRFGQGSEWLFCFHGYGEDSNHFTFLENALGDRFTLIAIDLPFHGRTDWQEGLSFEPADLISIINSIKPEEKPMYLLGYSMGGRIAMQLLQLMPQQIRKLVLVAPDGLHKNKWQWFATHTWMGNRLFAHTMRKPSWMMALMDLGGKLGIYNKSLLKFVHYRLDDASERSILYRRWTTLRKFRADLPVLKRIIIQNQVPVRMLFGRYDKIILTKHGTDFAQNSQGFISVVEIEAGHRLLKDEYAPLIASLILA